MPSRAHLQRQRSGFDTTMCRPHRSAPRSYWKHADTKTPARIFGASSTGFQRTSCVAACVMNHAVAWTEGALRGPGDYGARPQRETQQGALESRATNGQRRTTELRRVANTGRSLRKESARLL